MVLVVKKKKKKMDCGQLGCLLCSCIADWLSSKWKTYKVQIYFPQNIAKYKYSCILTSHHLYFWEYGVILTHNVRFTLSRYYNVWNTYSCIRLKGYLTSSSFFFFFWGNWGHFFPTVLKCFRSLCFCRQSFSPQPLKSFPSHDG